MKTKPCAKCFIGIGISDPSTALDENHWVIVSVFSPSDGARGQNNLMTFAAKFVTSRSVKKRSNWVAAKGVWQMNLAAIRKCS